MYTLGSLYAGVGGICYGFKKAGVELVWANEYDRFACQTYSLNFDHNLIQKDIWELNLKKLDRIDILTAGFPCQPFSIAGYRKGFEDERGNHFFRVLEYIKTQRPKAFLLENVKNLLSHDRGNTFKVIKESLQFHGYEIFFQIMNTKDYCNIPQNRERIFIVGFSKVNGCKIEFLFPEKVKLIKTISDFIEKKQTVEKYFYKPEWYGYKDLTKEVVSFNTIYQWRRHYVRVNKSNLCPTLTANMGTGGHNVPIIKTESGIRKLTPRECFLFQGFSKSFKLPKISDSHLYKQAGNSVTVPLIEKIAKEMIITLSRVYG